MNKHIELVKKWLSDRDSVTLEELKANKDAAYAAHADAAYANAAVYAAANAAYANAAYANAAYYADSAAYYIKRYEELTK